MSSEPIDIEKALRLAFNLGQTYWQQADSESYSQNRKSEATSAKFNALVAEVAAALEQPAPTAAPAERDMREVFETDHLGPLNSKRFADDERYIDPQVEREWFYFKAFWPIIRAATPPARLHAPLSDEQIDGLRGLDTAQRVRFYEHDFYVLSNFSAFNLQWTGLKFPTSEHAYHYMKFARPWAGEERGERADFNSPAVLIAQAICGAPSAHEAFKIAEQYKSARRPDWDQIKVGVMRDILRAKAMQHAYVHRKLLATGDRELVEDSWRDDFWGWGPDRNGKNMLGRLWMEVRAELHGITAAPAAQATNTEG